MSYKHPLQQEAPTLAEVQGKIVKIKPGKLTEVNYEQNKGLEKVTEETDHPEKDEASE